MILYSLFFGVWLYLAYKKQGLTPFTLLLIEYLIGSICGLLLYFFYDNPSRGWSISITAVVFHIVAMFLFMLPLESFFNIKYKRIKHVDINTLLLFAKILIIINIPAIIYNLATIRDTLTAFSSNLGAIRSAFYEDNIVVSEGFNWTRLAAATSLIALIPFFELISIKGYKKTKILLFISSLGIVADNLKAMSRDGLLIWLFAVTGLYLIYKDSFTIRLKETIYKRGGVAFAGIIAMFIAITVSRAAYDTNSDFNDPIFFSLNYAGQPFIHFSEMSNVDVLGVGSTYEKSVFFTFVSLPLQSFGVIGTIIAGLLFNLIIGLFKRNTIFDLTIYVYLYFFFTFGLLYPYFYFTASGPLGMMIIISTMAFFFSKSRISKKEVWNSIRK